jgi:hypothetical protein
MKVNIGMYFFPGKDDSFLDEAESWYLADLERDHSNQMQESKIQKILPPEVRNGGWYLSCIFFSQKI